MTIRAHTPTPWKSTGLYVSDHREYVVAQTKPVSRLMTDILRARANAEFICRAVNAHEALVEALHSVVTWFDALDREQHARFSQGQTLDSAARNWDLPSDVQMFEMQPLRDALRLAASSDQPGQEKP